MEQDFVGTKRWIRPATPYEVYMEEQNLPIHRGTVGFYEPDFGILEAHRRSRRVHRA